MPWCRPTSNSLPPSPTPPQGEFAESVRDQFLCERIEYFNALEEALYEEAGHAEECSVAHIARALMAMDSELSYRAASLLAAGVWGDSASELMSVKLAMKRVRLGVEPGTCCAVCHMIQFRGDGIGGDDMVRPSNPEVDEPPCRFQEVRSRRAKRIEPPALVPPCSLEDWLVQPAKGSRAWPRRKASLRACHGRQY